MPKFAISDDGTVNWENPPQTASAFEHPTVNGEPYARPRASSPRVVVMALSGMAAALLASVMTILPMPYAINQPGPTFDILDADTGPLLTIAGAQTYESTGELRITTVSQKRGSTARMTLGPVIRGWFSSTEHIFPESLLAPTPSGEETQAADEWVTSQQRAAVSALEELGIEVPVMLNVVEIMEISHAHGALAVGDTIVGIEGQRIVSYADISRILGDVGGGDSIDVMVDRAGSETTVSFATIDDGDGGALMGIWIRPDFDIPVDVDVAIDDVGGPSAGLMFALAIMDTLTPLDELGGASVAGTGTIDLDGDVGPIGGIEIKLAGAARDGAEWFLAPAENCAQVVGNIPDGLAVVSVEGLGDAYDALIAIGEGRTDRLPTCA